MAQHLNEPVVRTGLALTEGWFRAELGSLDTAWNPAEKLKLIAGPAELRYREILDDGSVEVVVTQTFNSRDKAKR
jgi:hypothetical protein